MVSQPVGGRVVVITGASSGFGRGSALKFASGGASLVLAARRGDVLESLAAECTSLGGLAMAVPTDVSEESQVRALAEAAVSRFGRIDVWVNDAGVGAIGRFDEVPMADHQQVIATDLLGTMYGSYAALKQFRAQGSGTLINIASALGKMPAPYYASYTAAKHGVVGLSGCLRLELRENGEDGIHVCVVMPMAMDTPFFEHAANYTGHESVPIPPLYDAEEVVDTIVGLVSDPKDEVTVGTQGKVSGVIGAVAPRLTERMMGRNTHKAQMVKAPAAPPTTGSLHCPAPEGTGVHGKWRPGDEKELK